MSKRFVDTLGQAVVAGRIAGDEFAAVVTDQEKWGKEFEEAVIAAAIDFCRSVRGVAQGVTISVGMEMYAPSRPVASPSVASREPGSAMVIGTNMLIGANRAVGAAKALGGDRVVLAGRRGGRVLLQPSRGWKALLRRS